MPKLFCIGVLGIMVLESKVLCAGQAKYLLWTGSLRPAATAATIPPATAQAMDASGVQAEESSSARTA